MGYFDNLNNRPLNKFKKILKIEKKNYRCVLLPMDSHSNFIQFHYRLIVHQRPLNWNCCKLHEKLMVFDGLSNDNEITWNLNDHQSIGRRTYL
jgi:hypothetical protein